MEKEKNKRKENTALRVNKGVEQPSQVNPAFSRSMKKFRKGKLEADILFEGIRSGDRNMLSRAITLIESSRSEDVEIARKLVNDCLPFAGNSVRIGITGVPGAGKSTFIEAFGNYLTGKGNKVAVLAIDPSSQRSKGSILGDKTRMETLSSQPNAFIRPSASAGTLGGVARATRETVVLCEAAGFDYIIIETVGVGQSETAVSKIVDFFLLLMIAGGGDELQGIKRGIMEMADLIVINKADGDNIKKAELARQEFTNALHLFPLLPSGWSPKVLTASALKGSGLKEIDHEINKYFELVKKNHYFDENRRQQALKILHETILRTLEGEFNDNPVIRKGMADIEKRILAEEISPYQAAQSLLEMYFKDISSRE